MSPLESRAWLQLWAMGPPYLVYFALNLAYPDGFERLGLIERLACFGAAALTHGAISLVGWLVLKWKERDERLILDERDHAIDGRAAQTGYAVLLLGIIVTGVVMPFTDHGWKIANTSILAMVLAEMVRHAQIALAYRKAVRLAG